jgi:hypothetical protein
MRSQRGTRGRFSSLYGTTMPRLWVEQEDHAWSCPLLDYCVPSTASSEQAAVQLQPLASIDASPLNPGKHVDAANVQRLADSLAADGLLQPKRRHASGRSVVVLAGERRLRVAQRLNWSEIPASVRDVEEGNRGSCRIRS